MSKQKEKHEEVASASRVDAPEIAELLQDCTDACAGKLRKLHTLAVSGTKDTLGLMWQQGQIIEQLREREMSRSRSGIEPVNPIALAASILERDIRYVNKVGQFHRAFKDRADLNRVLSLRLAATGRPLTWAHFEQLLKIFSEDGLNGPFEDLLATTVANSWTPEEIENHLKTRRRVQGEPDSRGGGRPTQVPATFDGKVTRILSHATVLAKNAQEIYLNEQHSFIQSLRGLSQHEVAKRASELRASIDRIEESGRDVVRLFEDLSGNQFPEMRQYIDDCESQCRDGG